MRLLYVHHRHSTIQRRKNVYPQFLHHINRSEFFQFSLNWLMLPWSYITEYYRRQNVYKQIFFLVYECVDFPLCENTKSKSENNRNNQNIHISRLTLKTTCNLCSPVREHWMTINSRRELYTQPHCLYHTAIHRYEFLVGVLNKTPIPATISYCRRWLQWRNCVLSIYVSLLLFDGV